MLSRLEIENIAIIESAAIEFGGGFNVLTGETGAGKSIVIDSISAVLGERTSRELIRTDCEKARVSAEFRHCCRAADDVLKTLEIDPMPDGSLLLQRIMYQDGRNSCRINGVPATVGMLKTVGDTLVSIHGQQDSHSLLTPDTHCAMIDSFAGNGPLLDLCKDGFEALTQLKSQLDELTANESQKARLSEMLAYQIEELEAARIKPGEREELTAKRNRFVHTGRIAEELQAALQALAGGEENGGVTGCAIAAAAHLSSAARLFPDMEPLAASASDIVYSAQELQTALNSALNSLEMAPGELEETESRLDELYKLSVKYGETEEDMLAFLDGARKELEAIEFSAQRAHSLKAEIEKIREQTEKIADELSARRKKAGEEFCLRVRRELSYLDMPNVVFMLRQSAKNLSADGIDNIEFALSANTGEEPKPLSKIASGGELSRIMLAIRSVFSAGRENETLIFDEIDTGISGRAANKVAVKLRSAAAGRQVICVTHLAQIAAAADNHYEISKSVTGGKTYTKVEKLDYEGRKRALAVIIGGLEITSAQLESAEEMLAQAGVSNK
ncbi:MAG TPA: DNA repair protein RecN [Clostridiales bacterium]|nr:DNA repair protein RecN [Clostridiales bacterium]